MKWSTLSYGFATRRTAMPRKSYKPEEIVAKLRQVDVLTSQSQSVAEAIRSIGVSEVTYYRWRQEYGGLKSDQVKRLKELETENTRLRRAVSDLTLDKLILQEASRYRRILVMAGGFRRRLFGISRAPGWGQLRSRR
jgi:transposase-like protein